MKHEVVRPVGTVLMLGALAVTATSQVAPTTTGQLAERYEAFGKKVRNLRAQCEMVHYFKVNNAPCTSSSSFEVRKANGVTNILGGGTSTSGFTPTYRHSDGETHQGIDPSYETLQFTSEKQNVWLTVRHDNLKDSVGANLQKTGEGIPNPAIEGHWIPKATGDVPLVSVQGGKLQATLSRGDDPPITIQVDPKLDYMITSRLVGTPSSPKSRTNIESVLTIDGLYFPGRVVNMTYSKDGSVYDRTSFVYQSYRLGGDVKLWMPRLPEGTIVIGGRSGVFVADAAGNMVRVGTKQKKESGLDSKTVVQFASLVGMFAFGGILLHRSLSKRWRSHRAP